MLADLSVTPDSVARIRDSIMQQAETQLADAALRFATEADALDSW
jgi:hypothetical protein